MTELVSNRGLPAGTIVTEVRQHPHIDENKEWKYTTETYHFTILTVGHREYLCRYIDNEYAVHEFYWYFWDTQPNFGFLPDGCSTVSYFAEIETGKE